MEEIKGFCVPTSWETFENGTEPLVPDRSCVLALECWNYKQILEDNEQEKKKLKEEMARLKFALKRSIETVSIITAENKELNKKIKENNQEIYQLQQDHQELKSKLLLTNRINENYKKIKLKLKEESNNCHDEVRELLAQRESENRGLRVVIEELKGDVMKSKKYISECQSTIQTIHSLNEDYKTEINTLESFIMKLQNDIRVEKGKNSTLSEQTETFQQKNEYITRSYHNLEEAYEELHGKYESLFAKNSKKQKKLTKLLKEREKILEVGLKLGMRKSHIYMLSSEEGDDEEDEGEEDDDSEQQRNENHQEFFDENETQNIFSNLNSNSNYNKLKYQQPSKQHSERNMSWDHIETDL